MPCISMYKTHFHFSIRILFHGRWQLTGQQGEEGDHLLFYSITSTRSQTFRHLFVTLHVRWLLRIFNLQRLYLPDCNSMSLTTLSNYYLIEWWCDVDFCLFACWSDFRFCCNYLTWETGDLEPTSTIILVLQANRLTKNSEYTYLTKKTLKKPLLHTLFCLFLKSSKAFNASLKRLGLNFVDSEIFRKFAKICFC